MTPREFDCVECGRHIVQMWDSNPDLMLCATCIVLPQWFKDSDARRMIDPTHDGLEAMERNPMTYKVVLNKHFGKFGDNVDG